jgi:hypothetical protein
VVRRQVLLPLSRVAPDGRKLLCSEVDMAVGILERPLIIFYSKELLGGEDLIEQLPASCVDPGVASLFRDPRRQIEESESRKR